MSVRPRPTIVNHYNLPGRASAATAYRLLPKTLGPQYYLERTDRNLGWITAQEQEMLRTTVVGIAGCGGMGGPLASIFLRLGVGEVRIADCETFDISNINRQFAAGWRTVGKSKAFKTAQLLRTIVEDTTVAVYPQGITEQTVDPFLAGCDIVCDEIEFWAVGARILLHQHAQALEVPLINCSTVGFGTRLFLFDHTGMGVGDMLGFSLAEAMELQQRLQQKVATKDEVRRVMDAMLDALITDVPEYGLSGAPHQSKTASLARLYDECRAPIIATNPPMASGFAANHTLLTLLQKHNPLRNVVRPPRTPGYLYFDSAFMQARIVERTEVSHA